MTRISLFLVAYSLLAVAASPVKAAASAASASPTAPSKGNAMESGRSSEHPYTLRVVEKALLTTAHTDFHGKAGTFEAAAGWNRERLRATAARGSSSSSTGPGRGGTRHPPRAPHLACTEYENGRDALHRLQNLLSRWAVRRVAHSEEIGACFFVSASNAEAEAIREWDAAHRLKSFTPFPSALKLAPGLLHYGEDDGEEARSGGGSSGRGDATGDAGKKNGSSTRLRAGHGRSMRGDNAEGLSVELTPGTLRENDPDALAFINELYEDLISESLNLHAINFWSDPSLLEDGADEHRRSTPHGAILEREWIKAATVVHKLTEEAGTSPADICSWDGILVQHPGDDVLFIKGMDHLLYSGRGAGGTAHEGEAAELHAACFMGLVSFFASRQEVVRVAPRRIQGLLNAAARANVQSATVTDTPLTDAGLDGSGQVIQVIDTGLDESSCFFANDETGEHITHGYYYDEWGTNLPMSYFLSGASASGGGGDEAAEGSLDYAEPAHHTSWYTSTVTSYRFSGGDFTVYPERRKIIQYINLIKPDDQPGSHGESFATSGGERYPWLSGDEFEYDYRAGHGTHVAGSAAGATLNDPAESVECESGKSLSCAGACIDTSLFASDDLLTTSMLDSLFDIDRLCSAYGCDPDTSELCLGDNVNQTLTDNGGVARGAKLAIFDIFYGLFGVGGYVGNGLWEPCNEADCRLHSNSWGGDYDCELGPLDTGYDEFMYENPENLLLFAAGNDGDDDTRTTCAMGSPAIAKNVLAVGASTSGSTRLSASELLLGADGSGIDEVAAFSSWGPTDDGRIKPEVVAPGDMIYSAASDGEEDEHSCRLFPFAGTSMSCPIVAGAAAMVRQYFMDDEFYAADMTARNWCDEWFGCESFRPSAATVKALLINSANLMGGSSEPDGFRGFGRVHLEAGMPLAGEGELVLFVADANRTSIPELTRHEYNFDVDADAGLELRVTLSWIDPPASTFSTVQLVHDLDLSVISPSGVRHTMWASGEADSSNVNERVIVDPDDLETGTWSVWVWARRLSTDEQNYSLVVSGAISPSTDIGAIERSSPSYSSGSSSMSTYSSPGVRGDAQDASGSVATTGLSTAAPVGLSLCVWMLFGSLASVIAAVA